LILIDAMWKIPLNHVHFMLTSKKAHTPNMSAKHFNLIYVTLPTVLLLLTSCYPKTEGTEELYQRQDALESKLDQLAEDLESGLTKIERNIERIESMQEKNVTLRRKIDKVAGPKANKSSKQAEKGKQPTNTADVIYSKAVTSYNDGKFEDAILDYQKLIDTYPRDKRVPDAYLKQGLALINLGRKQEAKFFLNTLIDKYPNSREAQTAKAKLKTI
jgi:TolA-binding protein